MLLVLESIRRKDEQLSNQRHVLDTLTGLEEQVGPAAGGARSARTGAGPRSAGAGATPLAGALSKTPAVEPQAAPLRAGSADTTARVPPPPPPPPLSPPLTTTTTTNPQVQVQLRELDSENKNLRQELERLDAQNNNLQVGPVGAWLASRPCRAAACRLRPLRVSLPHPSISPPQTNLSAAFTPLLNP